MVSKKLIKGLNFETIEDYFEYIFESRVNGQKQQAKDLYNLLSTRQKNDFNNWYCVFVAYDKDDMTETQALNDINTGKICTFFIQP